MNIVRTSIGHMIIKMNYFEIGGQKAKETCRFSEIHQVVIEHQIILDKIIPTKYIQPTFVV